MSVWTIVLGTIAVALTLWVLAMTTGCATSQGTQALQHGPFEVVAQGRRISSGGFPNTSANPFSSTEVTQFRVRHRGRDVAVPGDDGRTTRFWHLRRLLDSPRPAILVSTTNFHLITEENGEAVVRSIGEPGSAPAHLQWLDAEPGGQPGDTEMLGIDKVDIDAGTVLRGGRWLKISYHSVLDVQTLTVHAVRPWVPSVQGMPLAGLHGAGNAATAFSPGRTRYVVPGHGRDAGGASYDGLLVVDIASGDAEGVRLSRREARYVDLADITPAWVAHYFRWQRDAKGSERLVRNDDAKPLPWKGRIIDFSVQLEYRVARVRPEMKQVLARFLMQRFGAEVAPDWLDPAKTSGDTFRVPGCSHVLAVGHHEDHASVHAPAPRGLGHAADCQQIIRNVGAAFDAELATGRHDALFDAS